MKTLVEISISPATLLSSDGNLTDFTFNEPPVTILIPKKALIQTPEGFATADLSLITSLEQQLKTFTLHLLGDQINAELYQNDAFYSVRITENMPVLIESKLKKFTLFAKTTSTFQKESESMKKFYYAMRTLEQ